MTRFPSDVSELTPDLLTQVMAERHGDVRVEGIEIISKAQCGDGFASTADRVVLGLHYAKGRDAGLPTRVLLKTMLLQPHAPRVMYENEVRFYREIRPEIEIEAPQVHGSLFDRETGQFGVLMEDLSLRSASFPNATLTISIAHIESLVRNLAKLHAHYWQCSRFANDLSWLPTPRSGGMYKIFNGIGLELIKDQVAKNPFKAEVIAPLNRSLDELWADLWALQEILDSAPSTLLHGDSHIGNTYLLPDDSAGHLDWQLMVKGRWCHDLTYLLMTGLETPVRRENERELIRLYLDELRRGGVEDPPSDEDAWLGYRQSMVWGLVIGWLITPPTNYGEEITLANLRRIVTAIQDAETFTALGR